MRRSNVHSQFKPPLKQTDNMQSRTISVPVEGRDLSIRKVVEARDHYGRDTNESVTESEIDAYVDKLLASQPDKLCINLDQEMDKWRSRMHAYNEAKDACLILFGQLAHHRQCLVRELYTEFGLELTD